MLCHQLDSDGTAHAVADNHRTGDPELDAQPRHILGENSDGVVPFGGVTVAMAAQVGSHYAMVLFEVLELGREERVVARPAVDKHHGRAARARLVIGEAHAGTIQKDKHVGFPFGDGPTLPGQSAERNGLGLSPQDTDTFEAKQALARWRLAVHSSSAADHNGMTVTRSQRVVSQLLIWLGGGIKGIRRCKSVDMVWAQATLGT